MKIKGMIKTNFFADKIFKDGQEFPVVHDEQHIANGVITKVFPTSHMYEATVLPSKEVFVRDLILNRKVPRYVMTSEDMPHTKDTQIRFVIERLVDAVNGALENDPDCLGGDILGKREELNAAIKALGISTQIVDPNCGGCSSHI